jgi:xanthine dehydrogenase YagR molybdenum-binding subunit
VKVALARPQMANNTTHRPATIQRIRMGATADGKLSAIAHEGWSGNSRTARSKSPRNRASCFMPGQPPVTMRRAPLDLPEGNAMRAPGEAPGLMALEIAMDEMAEKLAGPGAVPHPQRHAGRSGQAERPFSQRRSVECLRPAPRNSAGTSATPHPVAVAKAAG